MKAILIINGKKYKAILAGEIYKINITEQN